MQAEVKQPCNSTGVLEDILVIFNELSLIKLRKAPIILRNASIDLLKFLGKAGIYNLAQCIGVENNLK